MSKRILITCKGAGETNPKALQQLEQAGCELVIPPEWGPFFGETLLGYLENVHGIIADLDGFTPEILQHPSAATLQIIARWGVGYDAIDIPAASQRKVLVTNTPGVLDPAVADLTFGLLLALARQIPQGHQTLMKGVWKKEWATDVHQKTLGLIGCGRIGQAVAKRATGFDMKILAYDHHPSAAALQLGVHFVSLEELLERSDFVSLHLALTPETRGFLSASRLSRMKPTALLINTARGALVDESALVDALRAGKIAGAALDTFVTEPLTLDHPLRSLSNVLLTPHQATYTRETGAAVTQRVVDNLLQFLQGTPPTNWINPHFAFPNQRVD